MVPSGDYRQIQISCFLLLLLDAPGYRPVVLGAGLYVTPEGSSIAQPVWARPIKEVGSSCRLVHLLKNSVGHLLFLLGNHPALDPVQLNHAQAALDA